MANNSGLPFSYTGAPRGAASLGLPFGIGTNPAAAGGIPGLPNFAINTTARPNSYIGLNSFVSVAAHYVSIPNQNQDDDPNSLTDSRELGLGMLVFCRDKDMTRRNNAKPIYGVPIGTDKSKNTLELKELTMLNTWLLKNSANYDTAEQVMAEWRLLGVIKTEAAPSYVPVYGNAASSRIVNLIVSHRISLLNYWSSCRIMQTQKMYLIVNRTSAGVWQITPFTSPEHDCPKLKHLVTTWGKDQDESMGAFYYVGKSSDEGWAHTSGAKRDTTNPDVVQSLVKRGLMSSIELYLGI